MTLGAAPVSDAGAIPVNATIEAGDRWTGYVESFRFESGSDRVTLTFSSPTSGTILFGEVPEDPPEPSSYSSWVRGFSPWGEYVEVEQVRALARFYERFPFTLGDVTYDGARIAFRIDLHEAWTIWCASRTPSCTSRGCTCVGPSDPDYEAYEAVCTNLNEVSPAFRVCRCSSTTCEVDFHHELVDSYLGDLWHLRFHLHIGGQAMTGTSEIGEVVLQKEKAAR
jgi:hypothetical protein